MFTLSNIQQSGAERWRIGPSWGRGGLRGEEE